MTEEHDFVFAWWGSQTDTTVRAVDIGQIPPVTGVPECYFDRSAIMVHFSELDDLDLDS